MSYLDEKTRKKIKKTFGETGSIRATAQKVGVSRNAVRRQLRRSDNSHAQVRSTTQRPSKLDPYKAKIQYLVEEKNLTHRARFRGNQSCRV